MEALGLEEVKEFSIEGVVELIEEKYKPLIDEQKQNFGDPISKYNIGLINYRIIQTCQHLYSTEKTQKLLAKDAEEYLTQIIPSLTGKTRETAQKILSVLEIYITTGNFSEI